LPRPPSRHILLRVLSVYSMETAPVKNVVPLTVHIDPKVKALATEAAKADRRTLSGLFEIWVLDNAPRIIAARKDKPA